MDNNQTVKGEICALQFIGSYHNPVQVNVLWWEGIVDKLKHQSIEFILSFLQTLLKEGLPFTIKVAHWIIERLENTLILGLEKLSQVDREGTELLKAELTKYQEFKGLVKKLAERQKNN